MTERLAKLIKMIDQGIISLEEALEIQDLTEEERNELANLPNA